MKFKKALGFVSLKYKEPSKCEACGGEFVCGATIKGCWCMKIKLSAETRDELKQNFRDCLCPDCLKKYAAAEEK